MTKTGWIILGVILLVLLIIGIVWYKNKSFLNKVPDTAAPATTKVPTAAAGATKTTTAAPTATAAVQPGAAV